MPKKKQQPAVEQERLTEWGEPFGKFYERMERLVVESKGWPLPWTDEWKKMYLVRGGK